MADFVAGWRRRDATYAATPPQWGCNRPLPAMPNHVHLTHPRMPNFPFLSLAALDNLSDAPQSMGVSYRLLLDACCVLCKTETQNQAGYLSLDPAGVQPVGQPLLLPAAYYYWHLGPENGHVCACDWKILNNFDEWEFPSAVAFSEGGAMAHWSLHTLSENVVTRNNKAFKTEVVARDALCVLTGGEYACQVSHLIPVGKALWFTVQNMSRFALSDAPGEIIYDCSNGVLLKPDMYNALDTYQLVFYPKDQSFVSHFLVALGREIQIDHNVPANIRDGVSIHFLFGRFAFNIIKRAQAACDVYARRKEWHSLMLTEPKAKAQSSTGSKRTSSAADMQSSASGSKHPVSTSSAAGNNAALQDVNKEAILSDVLSESIWDDMSAATWSPDTSHERTSSAISQDSQGLQSIVTAELYNSAIREIKKSTARSKVKLEALRALGTLFRPSFPQEDIARRQASQYEHNLHMGENLHEAKETGHDTAGQAEGNAKNVKVNAPAKAQENGGDRPGFSMQANL